MPPGHKLILLCLLSLAPPLMLVITPSGSPTEGQTYSLTCDLMGDESLDVADADNRFRWDRLTPMAMFQEGILRAPTLSFTPLTVADAGNYMCTNTITSPYLILSRTQFRTVIVFGKYDCDRHNTLIFWKFYLYEQFQLYITTLFSSLGTFEQKKKEAIQWPHSLVPRLSMSGWRRAWCTLIADPPTFPRGFLLQCVIMIFWLFTLSVDSKNTAKTWKLQEETLTTHYYSYNSQGCLCSLL